MSPRAELPASARCVIVGGGVGGVSIAYHLAELGYEDVVLLERAELTSGSTFHSAGLVGQLRGSVSLTKMMMHSVDLYRRLEDESEFDPGWVECGGIRLASSEERMEELRRQAGWAKTFGLPLDLISADEAKELFPLMSTEGVLGAAWLPTDGYLDPSQLTYALADGARRGGCEIHNSTRVTAIEVDRGRVRAVETDRGRIEAEVVVNAAGMYAAEIGRLAGVRVPVIPMSHQYLVTQPFRERGERRLPTLRDPDLLVYYREDGGGLVMGGYERHSKPAFMPDGPDGFDRIPRLQRPPARGRLGSLRGDHRELEAPRAGDERDQGDEADQRPRGVHARQRVLPRRDRGARPLRGRGLLRPWPRRGRRYREGDGRVDRGGRAEPRPLAHGRPPLRRPLPLAVLHPRADQGDLRDLLRHPVPEPRARGRAAAAGLARQRLARRARSRVRREVRLGAGQLVRVERRRGRRVASPPGLGRPALVAGDRRRAPGDARGGGPVRRVLLREDGDRRPGRGRAARAPLRQPRRPRHRPDHLHPDAQQPAAASSATSPSPASPRSASRSSPAPRSATTTASGSAATSPRTGRSGSAT